MDRNILLPLRRGVVPLVALRKESVDRNVEEFLNAGMLDRSLSARRAWIEIFLPRIPHGPRLSLSARRAWIEIAVQTVPSRVSTVALRKESVDRNEEYKEDPAGHGVALRKESVDRNA